MRNCSTTSNLMNYTYYLCNIMNKKGQVVVIYSGLQKAFDKVDHRLLLYKLNFYSFPNPRWKCYPVIFQTVNPSLSFLT